ncbi:MAG TPA: DUF47 family protein [Clostridiales bacterium]|nr:DUF47 family protein [Clostridiales bacterium]
MKNKTGEKTQAKGSLLEKDFKKQPETLAQKIKSKLTKDKIDYFDMLVKGAAISLEAAKNLKAAFADSEINKEEIRRIKEVEHKGDKHMHESQRIIEAAFITPIDQGDIMGILKGIENITDSIDDIANHIYIMRVEKSDEFMSRFVQIMISSCEKTYALMDALKQFRKNPNKNINTLIIEINALEEEGDRIYSESMRHLFGFETDPVNIIKKKEIYQCLEHTLDCCEDVADMVENLMIAKS